MFAVIYYSTVAPFHHIWSREHAKYETIMLCSVPVWPVRTEQIRMELSRATKWPSQTSQTFCYLCLYPWLLTFPLTIRWGFFIAIKFRNFRGLDTCALLIVWCNSQAMQAEFKKLRTKLQENGAISGIINNKYLILWFNI